MMTYQLTLYRDGKELGPVLCIDLTHPMTECHVCGAETPSHWGLPVWNGSIVANDWPGEWGGVPACYSCWERHERGELVEVPTSDYAAIFGEGNA